MRKLVISISAALVLVGSLYFLVEEEILRLPDGLVRDIISTNQDSRYKDKAQVALNRVIRKFSVESNKLDYLIEQTSEEIVLLAAGRPSSAASTLLDFVGAHPYCTRVRLVDRDLNILFSTSASDRSDSRVDARYSETFERRPGSESRIMVDPLINKLVMFKVIDRYALLFYFTQDMLDPVFAGMNDLEYRSFLVTTNRILLVNFPDIGASDERNLSRLVERMLENREGAVRVKMEGMDKIVYYTTDPQQYTDWTVGVTLETEKIRISTIGAVVLVIQAFVVTALVIFLVTTLGRREVPAAERAGAGLAGSFTGAASSGARQAYAGAQAGVNEAPGQVEEESPGDDSDLAEFDDLEAVPLDQVEPLEELEEVGEAEVAESIEELDEAGDFDQEDETDVQHEPEEHSDLSAGGSWHENGHESTSESGNEKGHESTNESTSESGNENGHENGKEPGSQYEGGETSETSALYGEDEPGQPHAGPGHTAGYEEPVYDDRRELETFTDTDSGTLPGLEKLLQPEDGTDLETDVQGEGEYIEFPSDVPEVTESDYLDLPEDAVSRARGEVDLDSGAPDDKQTATLPDDETGHADIEAMNAVDEADSSNSDLLHVDLPEAEEEDQEDETLPVIPEHAYSGSGRRRDDELARLIQRIEQNRQESDTIVESGGGGPEAVEKEFNAFMDELGLSKGALLLEYKDAETPGEFRPAVSIGLSESTTSLLRFSSNEKIVRAILMRDKILYIRDDAFMSRLMRTKFSPGDTVSVKRLFFAPIFSRNPESRALKAVLMVCLTNAEAVSEHSRSERILEELKRIKKRLPSLI